MTSSLTKLQWTVAGAAWLLAGTRLTGTAARAAGEETGVEVKPVRMEKRLNVPDKTLTAVVVS